MKITKEVHDILEYLSYKYEQYKMKINKGKIKFIADKKKH